MAQATLNIDGQVFCTLDIDGSPMPPSANMIETVIVMEGFGMPLPVLKMSLYDDNETLSKDLNLKNGTLIKIRLGKSSSESPESAFRVFGWGRPRNSTGKVLHIVALFDCPLFGAGAYSESYEGTSKDVMAKIASACGLKFEGPSANTDDSQVWLNFNTTRLSFTEDIAMRGFVNESSCMVRCVSTDGTLHYKNLMEVIKQEPKHSISHNSNGKGKSGKPIDVRGAKDTSVSGVFTHFMNYGFTLHGHDFDEEQHAFASLDVDVQGVDVPINKEVKGQLENGSRVSYFGLDYRHGPNDGYNLHENYERAYYQNVRLLGLFSERVTAIADEATDTTLFEPVDFTQGAGGKGQQSPATNDVSGKYILGGRTKVIKGGTKYSELFYLYRPFITEAGNPGGLSPQKKTGQASSSGVDQSARNFQ